MGGSKDSFTTYNPVTNFLFFIGAIVLGMLFRHPLFTLCSLVCSLVYYFTIKKEKGLSFFSFMMVIFIVLTFINPIFNIMGSHELFVVFGRPYYFEALANGAAMAGMVVTVLAWFACYNAVMTSDKFIYIFGRIIPSMSLVLSMILRLIPGLRNKFSQISGARKCVGMSAENLAAKDKVKNGMTELSVLTSWALEGGIITADSMRSRGYGSGKRTFFAIYGFDFRNICAILFMVIMMAAAIVCSIHGATEVEFYPEITAKGLENPYVAVGLAAYFIFLMVPTFLNIKEAIVWKVLRARL